MNGQHITVVGAGAIGGRMAARFALAGHSVTVVARGEHLRAMQQSGLTIVEPTGTRRVDVRAVDDAHIPAEPQQLVVIALKAHQIAPLLPRIAALLGDDTVVVPAINGLPWWYFHGDAAHAGQRIECLDPDDAMAAALDAQRIIGCVVHASAEVTAPGTVLSNGQNRLILGEPSQQLTPRLQAVAALFEQAGFEVKRSARIRDDIWMKLVGNVSFNPVAALTRARMDQINRNPELIALIRRVMEETMAVARAYGCDPQVGVDERIAIGRGIGAVKISMHQDVERGRPLELDAIVRAPVELGRKAGVPMPFTEAMLALTDEFNRRVLLHEAD
ncbi:MAG: 2-dehydropantoate 2-reductase [Betaproteobacteria bacterium]|nr:2-dehydropantoate 2-reductase [Betaproteobacteria bacterium]